MPATISPAPWQDWHQPPPQPSDPYRVVIRALDGTAVAALTVGSPGAAWPPKEIVLANARLLAEAPALAMLIREASAPGGIGPHAFPGFRERCLAALARVDGGPRDAGLLPEPTWDELLKILRRLVAWAGTMGGWEAEAWREAEGLLARAGVRP